jgi:hypothetical protein
MELLHPVYEFRPLPDAFPRRWDQDVLRFADGQWLPDDGEHDIAFVSDVFCLMVELPYQRNILWSWTTGHWSSFEAKHPRGNAWHHMLRDGEAEWGGDWGRALHQNRKAGDAGMNRQCGIHHSATGLHVRFQLDDKHIAAGMVRERDSKRVLTFPAKPCCMYCGDDGHVPLSKPEAA